MTTDPATARPPRARRWIAAGAVGAAGVLVAVVVAADGGKEDAASAGGASQATKTTRIVRQDLVESEEVDGTLGFSDARTVVNRLSGTVTWTPSAGAVVRTNHRLFEVDGRAVYLLHGAYPAFRTLRSGLRGDDVRQLERNLRVLDLDPDGDMQVDGTWDAGTTAAVRRWQARKGLAETGRIELGRIVFQPGARRVGTVALPAGSSASGGGAGTSGGGSTAPAAFDGEAASPGTPASTGAARGRTVFVRATLRQDGTAVAAPGATAPATATAPAATVPEPATTTGTKTTPEPATTAGTTTTPRPARTTTTTTTTRPATTTGTTTTPRPATTSTAPARTTPSPQPAAPTGRPAGGGGRAVGAAAPSAAGATGGTSTAAGAGQAPAAAASGGTQDAVRAELMTTTSTKRIVAVDLEVSDRELASAGDAVQVELPGGTEVEGTVARVGTVARKQATAQDEDPPATVKVIVKLRRSAGGGLDQAPVDVRLERSRAKDALTIPVTALLARAGGSFAVEVREGDRRRVVPVETGLYTDADVQVTGEGLREGMTITDAGV